jgi:replicative DNA helicase
MPLHSLQIEKHVIGGLIQNQDVIPEIESFVKEKDFVAQPHSTIYSCITSSYLNNEKIDKVILAQKIKNLGISFKDNINIFDYIESISFAPITRDATLKACKELVKFRALRDIDDSCDRIKSHINKSINQDLNFTISEVDAIYGEKIISFDDDGKPAELFNDILDLVEERGNNPQDETGLTTPYPEFNKFYGGLRGGNIYAVASRAGQGKTTILNDWANESGRINNVPVLILDTEMTTQEIKFRTAAANTNVPLWYLETGNWRKNPDYVEKVRKHLKNLKKDYKTYHFYVGNKNVDEVCSIVRRWYLNVVGRGNKCIVVYDYLKLTGEKLAQNWAEHQALGEKVDKLKRICVEFNFPLLTAIQLNRSGENTNRKAQDVVDDGSAIALSDRLMWFTTYLGIFRRRTEDEMVLDTPESGTHKLIEIKARYQGRNAAGHSNLIRRQFPDGTVKYVPNFINFNISNFRVEERGSLQDTIERQNSQFLAADAPHRGEETL